MRSSMLAKIMLATTLLAIYVSMALAEQENENGNYAMIPDTYNSLSAIDMPSTSSTSNTSDMFGIPGLSDLTSNLTVNGNYDFSNKSIVLLPNMTVNIIVIQNMTTINNNLVPPLDVIAKSPVRQPFEPS
ncbi:MAG: hypothetical protein MUO26_08055 [Methanotrichaceae archaeon]|nr:hypothetical protein [Methanotrichaceae archaeon]